MMSTDAPGQFLGYTLQIPRALFHLLNGYEGDVVCVEINGDVLKESEDGDVLSEEDKSSINSNPLTNKSTDLWKTFFNWITAINSGALDVEKTKFLLYTNKSGRSGIVNSFDGAKNKSDALDVISKAKDILKDIDEKHDIWKFYDFVINKNESILEEVIQKFELQIGDGAGYGEVESELARLMVPANKIQYMCDSLSGWVLKEISEKIANKKLSMIKREDFSSRFIVLFDAVRSSELIDFTLHDEVKEGDVEQQVRVKPRYLLQLEALGSSGDDMVEAVSDFLRAKVNREKWIENDIIDEDSAADFQNKLILFWGNKQKRIEITEKSLSEEERGQLLLLDCQSHQVTIRNMSPPAFTISGTYHALADDPVLGWHPNWKKLFKK